MAEHITISKEVQFDAGHRVPNHVSKCKNPHGHRYRLVAHCEGHIIDDPDHPEDGMLVDFGRLKDYLTQIHDLFDHGMIIHIDDLDLLDMYGLVNQEGDTRWYDASNEPINGWRVFVFPYVPTAENIARWCFDTLDSMITDRYGNDLRLEAIEVWETPTSQAVYSR